MTLTLVIEINCRMISFSIDAAPVPVRYVAIDNDRDKGLVSHYYRCLVCWQIVNDEVQRMGAAHLDQSEADERHWDHY